MAGFVRKHARDLSQKDVKRLLAYVSNSGRHRTRNRLIVLLSFYAGLRASEIANLRWRMVLDKNRQIGDILKLENTAAKKLSGRLIPIKDEIKRYLILYYHEFRVVDENEYIIRSQQGGMLKPQAIVNWFRTIYKSIDMTGCSSHSGRRYFVTMAARKIFEAGGSLKDVQDLAGHKSISTTQLYIAVNSEAQIKLIKLL